MFKSLLALIDGDRSNSALIESTVDLAGSMPAELLAMGVIDPDVVTPHEPVPLGAGHAKHELDTSRMEAARREVEAGLARLASRCSSAGVSFQAVESLGEPLDLILSTAPLVDLIVMNRPSDDLQAHLHLGASALRQLLHASPRPVLLIPESCAPARSALIAYDGSLQSVRTLQLFALSGLAADRTVHVVSLAADARQAAAVASQAIQYLGRYGTVAQHYSEGFDGNAGRRILELASERQAGMVVMGAYGQRFVRELFLGSVTRTVIDESAVPVFLYH
jgi:nucleotide-binding universal stress UspA family protein